MACSVATMNLADQFELKGRVCVLLVIQKTKKYQEPNIHESTLALWIQKSQRKAYK